MRVVRGREVGASDLPSTVATVGAFAVVHRGHETLLRRVHEEAGRLGAAPALVTFDPHPQEVLRPDEAPCRLATLAQRLEQFEADGVQVVLVVPFTRDLSELSPEAFVREVLVGTVHIRKVVVGEDFRFGHDRAGDVGTLRELGAEHGFEVEAMPLVRNGGQKVSSTDIRRLVRAGRVGEANALLGHPFRLAGTVVHGDKRGRDIGFPTANIDPAPRACVPGHGVYAGRWIWRGKAYPGAVNVGVRPTFESSERSVVEIHVLDFAEDLYGETGEVEFTHRLRDELRFDGVDALVEQMHRDVQQARRLLSG